MSTLVYVTVQKTCQIEEALNLTDKSLCLATRSMCLDKALFLIEKCSELRDYAVSTLQTTSSTSNNIKYLYSMKLMVETYP